METLTQRALRLARMRANGNRNYARFGGHVRPSGRAVRAVWQVVTRQPCISLAALEDTTGFSRSYASQCLYVLRANGLIAYDSGNRAARRVLVPFGWEWLGD